MGIGCEMTGGSSGGGWFAGWNDTTGGTLHSVISTHTDYKSHGPYLGTMARSEFKYWRDDVPR